MGHELTSHDLSLVRENLDLTGALFPCLVRLNKEQLILDVKQVREEKLKLADETSGRGEALPQLIRFHLLDV